METCHGFEVGAEVELQEVVELVEECPSITVENKHDLPVWQTSHCIDDLISDEELDSQPVLSPSPEIENLKVFDSSFIETKIRYEERGTASEKTAPLSVSDGSLTGFQSHGLTSDTESMLWNNYFLQDPDNPLEVISGTGETETMRNSDTRQNQALYRLPSNFNHMSSESAWSEQEKNEDSEHFSYYNANTNFRGSVKPSVRRHKCPRCGRSFRRLCNLEKHLCLKMAMGFSVANGSNPGQVVPSAKATMKVNGHENNYQSNSGSDELLEQMCAKAQQELHLIQQQHGKSGPSDEKSVRQEYETIEKAHLPVTPSLIENLYAPTFPLFFPCKECGRYIHKNSVDSHSCWNKDSSLSFLEGVATANKSQMPALGRSQREKSNNLEYTDIIQVITPGTPAKRPKIHSVAEESITTKGKLSKTSFFCDRCGRIFRHKHTLEKHKCTKKDISTSPIQNSLEESHKSTARYPYSLQRSKSYINAEKGTLVQTHKDDAMYKKIDFFHDPGSLDFAETNMDYVIGTAEDGTLYDGEDIPIDFIDSEGMRNTGETEGQLEHSLPFEKDWDGQSPDIIKHLIPRPVTLPLKTLARIGKRLKHSYQCQDCGAQFLQYSQWKRHQQKGKVHKGGLKENHKCDCGRHIFGPLHLLRHQLQHISGTPFVCSVCGQCLRGYRRLQAHSWVHPLASRFQCDCGEMFTHLSRYLWHSLLNSKSPKGKHTKAVRS
ncbi:zinc finger 70-like [Pelobates cultripes]|uniref:Zinc finger 70-like n=1 Tax=Pelobates cultripes TaxID=61616 RepID=A0AAD1T6M9_PELCU|nr:zinc finger 70-like [Pelobates cultripes]